MFRILALHLIVLCGVAGAQDRLPSWNDSATRSAILHFVDSVTDQSSKHYRPPWERVAVFDNDGTLWSEKPFYFQGAFAFDRVKTLAAQRPEWRTKEPYKSVLDDDLAGVIRSGHEGIAQIVAATHSDMSTGEFDRVVRNWIHSARHPETGRLYRDMVYQPMLEVLSLLAENEFDVWIVSAGGMELMRVWAEEVYGIPPERVIGSYTKIRMAQNTSGANATPVLIRVPELDFVNDGDGKVVSIHRFIRRRPIIAFGNSDGDLQMLKWTTTGPGLTFGGLVHHTDSEREWAYDRKSSVGRLDMGLEQAPEQGWQIVDMRSDWRTIHKQVHHYFHKAKSTHSAHWGYSGATGPQHWV